MRLFGPPSLWLLALRKARMSPTSNLRSEMAATLADLTSNAAFRSVRDSVTVEGLVWVEPTLGGGMLDPIDELTIDTAMLQKEMAALATLWLIGRHAGGAALYMDQGCTQAFLQPASFYSPTLFVPSGVTAESVAAAFSLYSGGEDETGMDTADSSTQTVRLFLGSQDMGLPGIEDIETHLFASKFCEPDSLVSSEEDEDGSDGGETEDKDEDRILSCSIRTRHSLCLLKVEQHPQLTVVEVTYPATGVASSARPTADGFNAVFGSGFPDGLPNDALGALGLCGFANQNPDQIREEFLRSDQTQNVLSSVYLLAFLVEDEELHADLTTVAGHPDPQVRISVFMVAAQKDHPLLNTQLVGQMMAVESNPEVAGAFQQIKAAISEEAEAEAAGSAGGGMDMGMD